MRSLIPVAMIVLFLAMLFPAMQRSMEGGSAYPVWSTHRSDPEGVKALYLAVEETAKTPVERNYIPPAELKPRRAQFVLLGVSPMLLDRDEVVSPLVAGGGVAVLGLAAGRPILEKESARIGFQVDKGGTLRLLEPKWRCLLGAREDCHLASRPHGKGEVWVLPNANRLRNAELRRAAPLAVIREVFRTGLPIVFDEQHLGVTDQTGVGVLLRRFRLFPLMAVLLGVALLFIWRSSVSLLPERPPDVDAAIPAPAASLETLLAQRIPRGKRLDTVVSEWRRALPLLPAWHRDRAEEMDAALEQAKLAPDMTSGYEELRRVVRPRRGLA